MTNIPVYIINFNNLNRGFLKLVTWLKSAGMSNIIVVDNGSTYPLLMNYYKSCDLSVVRMKQNFGPWVFWETGMHKEQRDRYIVTDPDVVPAESCPRDIIEKMCKVADRYLPQQTKVGPGLRIDNLPECFAGRHRVYLVEKGYSLSKLLVPEKDAFTAPIDTTFALYSPRAAHQVSGPQLRLSAPYMFEHLPWYEDSSVPNEERDYYLSKAKTGWANWGYAKHDLNTTDLHNPFLPIRGHSTPPSRVHAKTGYCRKHKVLGCGPCSLDQGIRY